MPAAPKHFPNAIERSVMQRLDFAKGKPTNEMGAGRRIISNLATKGWIERFDDGYRLTLAGREAFKRPIPIKK